MTLRSVSVLMPTTDMMHSETTRCLVEMMMTSGMRARDAGLGNISLHMYQSSMLPQSRNVLAASALEIGATHLLWIDSDMTFPRDMLLRFLQREEKLIGINAIQRKPPFNNSAQRDDFSQVMTREDSTGIEKVRRTGFGVMWAASEVFQAIPKPWFDYEYLSDLDCFRGEDYGFCERAIAAGYVVHIDHDLSRQVGHLGTFAYGPVMKQQAEAIAQLEGMRPL